MPVRICVTRKKLSIPPKVYHQLTNVGDEPAIMLYIFSPVGYVAHPDQELSGR